MRGLVNGDGWIRYFLRGDSFADVWRMLWGFAEEAGKDPDILVSTNQLPIMIGPRAKVEAPMKEWLNTEWDFASWSKSTPDSAIMGTVEECVEQLQAHIDTGIDRLIFVPYNSEPEQVEAIAREIIPALQSS